jgi:general secretion pathway protein G
MQAMKKGIQMRSNRKGFTLIELLTVVIIIGMLAAFVAPRMFRGLGKAKRDIAKAKMALVERGLGEFFLHCGRLPTEDEGLQALIEAPADLEEKWNGRYLKPSEIIDPWDNPFEYYEGSGELGTKEYELISYGADGAEGGEGENEDITND